MILSKDQILQEDIYCEISGVNSWTVSVAMQAGDLTGALWWSLSRGVKC